jgi:hypothetical protein
MITTVVWVTPVGVAIIGIAPRIVSAAAAVIAGSTGVVSIVVAAAGITDPDRPIAPSRADGDGSVC